jgi:hypothetical protein
MKIPKIFCLAAVAAALLPLNIVSASDSEARTNPHLKPFAELKAPELPAECASLVSKASAEQVESVTVDVVSAASKVNAPVVSAVVGAIAAARPEMAALAAATAVGHQPKQASQIVRAAVGSAPDRTGAIVHAVCLRNPSVYRTVAAVAAKLAPEKRSEILEAIASAIPAQRPFIAKAQAGQPADMSVLAVLDEASHLSAQSGGNGAVVAASNRGPTVGPPFQPLIGTPGNTGPGDSTDVPPDGRDYSAP